MADRSERIKKRLLTAAEEEMERESYIRKDDLLPHFKTLIEFVKTLKPELLKRVDEKFKDKLASIQATQAKLERILKEAKTTRDADVSKLTRKIEEGLIDLKDAIYELPTSEDVLTTVQAAIDSLEEQTPELIRQKLEKVGLPVSAVLGLDEKLETLKKETNQRTAGAGVTNMRIAQSFKYILRTEEPSGAINGSNTAYTVTQPILAVLAFSLSGEVIAQLPNYTIAGRTITFSSALPAAYSGKDFEVKYIAG